MQSIVERYDLAIYLCDRELISDLTVYRVGEVDRSGSFRKRDDIPLRCEDKYLIREHIHIHLFHELTSFERVFYYFFDRRHPVAILRFYGCSLFCVFEVGCDSDLCLDMHLFCAYLDLCRLRTNFRKESDDGRME